MKKMIKFFLSYFLLELNNVILQHIKIFSKFKKRKFKKNFLTIY